MGDVLTTHMLLCHTKFSIIVANINLYQNKFLFKKLIIRFVSKILMGICI